jgi:hypothetical protein
MRNAQMARINNNAKLAPATNEQAKGKGKKAGGSAVTKLDPERYTGLGAEMAQAAASQTVAVGTLWNRCRTLFTEAQRIGKAGEAVELLFAPGERVKGKKAPWYRTYKSLLTNAVKLNVPVTDDMGMTALQKAIKAAKETAEENDPEAAKAKNAQMLGMFQRMVSGCLARGISKADLARIVKEAEA